MIKQSRIVRDQFPRADRTVRHRSSANRGFIGTFLVTISVCVAPAEPKGLDSPYKENAWLSKVGQHVLNLRCSGNHSNDRDALRVPLSPEHHRDATEVPARGSRAPRARSAPLLHDYALVCSC